ncbi:MAG: YkgJ family cysteine cluster protein, partial [Verrucomicrobiota bacterium]
MDKIFKNGIRFECQGTGRCCVSRGEYGHVYVSLEDRRRMARHFGVTTLQFTKRYCDKTDDHFHLKAPEKDCMFLADTQCSVYQARPTQCRTWPFWPENMNAKVWASDVASFCPGVGKGKLYSPEEIEEILNMNEGHIAALVSSFFNSTTPPPRPLHYNRISEC